MEWAELTLAEQCVLDNAMDEGDLRSLLVLCAPRHNEGSRPEYIEVLGDAVLRLLGLRLIEISSTMFPGKSEPIVEASVESIVRSPGNWWNDAFDITDGEVADGGVDEVVWLALTEMGEAVLSTATSEQLSEYRRSERAVGYLRLRALRE